MGELSTLGLRCKQCHILDYFKQLILVSNENQIFCINFVIIQKLILHQVSSVNVAKSQHLNNNIILLSPFFEPGRPSTKFYKQSTQIKNYILNSYQL